MAEERRTTIKLTVPLVAKLRPRDGRGWYAWDSEEKGLAVRVYDSGRKAWILGYRPQNSRRFRKITLGAIGDLSLKEARKRARELRGDIVRGGDPLSERQGARRAPTVAEMGERYLVHIDALRKPQTVREYRRLWEKHVLKALGSRKVAEIETADVARLHRKIAAKYVGNRVVNLLGAFFTFCEREGARSRGSNPASEVERHRESTRERRLTSEEFGRLGDALRRAAEVGLRPAPRLRREPKGEHTVKHRPKEWDRVYPANPSAVACIRFLALTGLRRGEALNLRWENLDFEHSLIVLRESKTGRSERPLPAPAKLFLAALPRTSDYVFPGIDGNPLVNLKRIWASITYEAKLDGLRIHDLRHSYASVSASSGDSMLIIRNLLGHKTAKMAERYAHLAPSPVHAAASRVSEGIAAMLSGLSSGKARAG